MVSKPFYLTLPSVCSYTMTKVANQVQGSSEKEVITSKVILLKQCT